MYLSLSQRVIAGFTVVILFVLAIGASAYISQKNMAGQLELTASTLTGLLDSSNTLVLNIENINRSTLVHANTLDSKTRQQLSQAVTQSITQYQHTEEALQAQLKPYPQLSRHLAAINKEAAQFIALAKAHQTIQNQRVAARAASAQELNKFDEGWLFFEQDIADLKNSAANDKIQQAQWDIDVILAQGLGAKSYLQKVLAVEDDKQIATLNKEVRGHLSLIREKSTEVMQLMPGSKETLKIYLDLLNRSIAEPQGLLQQHLHYLALQKKSSQTLHTIDQDVNTILTNASALTAELRAMSQKALKKAKQESTYSMAINSFLALLAIVVAIVVAITVVLSVKKPVSVITQALHKLAGGDLSWRIEEKFRSEMGSVVNNINQLAEQLTELISQVQQSADTVNSVASASYTMTEKTNREVAEQRHQTDSIATAITEMESAINEVSGNASQASQEVEQLTQQANTNMANMQSNVEFIHQLKSSLDEAAGTIQTLSSESEQISAVLEVIGEITEQTNLLALNAAIEAARAGESGRGFAVVADEVRLLATRSQASASEIGTMIESLQNKSRQAVAIVEHNLSYADESVLQSEQTSTSLNQMVQRLHVINDMSRSIASACEEQSVVAREVAQNVVGISDMATSIAADSEKLAHNNRSLSELATQQNTLIARFTL